MPRQTKGTIKRLDNGKYIVRATAGVRPDGKRNTLTKTVATKREAEYALKVFLQDANKEKEKQERYSVFQLTIQECFENEFLPYKGRTLKPQSYTRLQSIINTHIIPHHGHISIYNLKGEQINQLLDSLHSQGKSYSTVKKVHDAYNAMYDYLIHKKHCMDPGENPMDIVEMIPEKKFKRIDSTDKWFTPDEVLAIAQECLKETPTTKQMIYKYGNVFMLMLNTGIREGEACGLKKKDIDFNNGTMTISRSVYVEKGDNNYTVKLGTVKYANSNRIVSLSDEALIYIKRLLKQFPDTDMLIYNEDHSLVRPATLSKSFSKVLKNIGLSKGSLHSLRHTYVSMLFDMGVNLYVIASQIGDDPSTVKKTYLHLYQKRTATQVINMNVTSRAQQMIDEGITY